jgi:hypothetical protein
MKKDLITLSLLVIVGAAVYYFVIYFPHNTVASQPAQQTVSTDPVSYQGSVIETGGVGTFIVTRQAWSTETGDYLKPSEDYVITSFNRPGDVMYVDCKTGYNITSVQSPTANRVMQPQDTDPGEAGIQIENKLQNTITVTCGKQ